MELSNDVCFLEGITSVSALIKAERQGIARRQILTIYIDESKRKSEQRRISFLSAAAKELKFSLSFVKKDEIDSSAQGHTHGGILAKTGPAVFPGLDELVPSGAGFSMLLEGAEDPYSLGHSIRALYSCGAKELIIPHRYPTGADAVLARASAGCSELLPMFICDPADAVKKYKEAGYTIAAAGIRDAEELCTCTLNAPVLLVIGGEKRGISASVAALADINVKIPYERDFMGSLPTETAVSIFAYEMMRRKL